MDDLVTWLRAQLDDDERIARAFADETGSDSLRWHRPDPQQPGLIRDGSGTVVTYDEGVLTAEQAEHIARHDPARVLTEVDAKRLRLDLIAELATRDSDTALRFAKAEALPYADRAGYCEEWRPDTST